ncbi:MAG: hypothetical protein QNJ40_18425 [Xanthomonadales bacterium]|nr:hypothetical protein [Xanthomonadales bacterium]
MNQETAKKLMSALAWMETPFRAFERQLHEVDDEHEARQLREAFGQLIGEKMELERLITNQFPKLAFGSDWYVSLLKKYETAEYPYSELSEEQKRSAQRAGLRAAAEIRKEMGLTKRFDAGE